MFLKFYNIRTVAVLFALTLTSGSCLKDSCNVKTPATMYIPVYTSLSTLRAAVKSEAPRNIEQTGKIYIYGKYIFLNEVGKGIHVIDNSPPSAPNKIAFVNIPGNVDIAVKGNILYADSYIDLVSLDISDVNNIRETGRLKSVLPSVYYQYGIYTDTTKGVIVSFDKRDTVLVNTCHNDQWNGEYLNYYANNSAIVSNTASSGSPSPTGQAGSTAKFGLLGDYLYTVNISHLQPFNIEEPAHPVAKEIVQLSARVETIFPNSHYLYLGTTTGMFIYDATNPAVPQLKGNYIHVTGCDPVVVEDNKAYVTIRGGATCNNNNTNVLSVLDVQNPEEPVLLKNYTMLSPYGLGIDNNRLFICEGSNGLRFMNATDPLNITVDGNLNGPEVYDVIPEGNNLLLVTAKDGIYQYDYTDMKAPKLLSKLGITPNK
jgi:hypothetical protein